MSDEERLRAILLDAVPPLSGPENWSAVVTRRVRRARRRIALAAAIGTVAVVIGSGMTVQWMGNTATLPGGRATTCPEEWTDWVRSVPQGDAPGRFIDPAGVASVSLCSNLGGPQGKGAVWTLDTGLSQMVDLFNAMPTQAEFNEQAKRAHPDSKIPPIWTCDAVAYAPQYTFAVTYTDGRVATILTDRSCILAYLDGHLRVMQPSPVDTFKQLYLSQQISRTDPATVATPSCPPTVSGTVEFTDQIGEMRIETPTLRNQFLPTPLVAIALCRYAGDGTELHLTAHYETRLTGPVATWRQRINDVTAAHGSTTGCSGHWDIAGATALDVMWAVDETGAVSAVPVEWAPCPQVFARGMSISPPADLKEDLDQLLATR